MKSLYSTPLDRSAAELWSLVLMAVNVSHRIAFYPGGWAIEVAVVDVDFARSQIDAFEIENQNWPPPETEVDESDSGEQSAILFVVGLLVFYWVTGPWQTGNVWFKTGAVSAHEIIQQHEWWRLVTGLTLHADPVHLLGNIIFGGMLLYFLKRQVGSGAAWLTALLSGIAGNALNIIFRNGPHLSVGFSTAVFGLVGSLSALRWLRHGFSLKGFLLPLGSAFGLLAFLGAGGEKTDLGAHFWGLAAGGLIGFILALLNPLLKSDDGVISQLLMIAVCLIIGGGWYCARSGG